ncbi:unnamed protein product [Closterium sp. NIES-64]|nr:unnamed protein product [Closterium sp. NIES-64]CAI5979558.1 unnamed protein product [Closterium sp. NIES-64]
MLRQPHSIQLITRSRRSSAPVAHPLSSLTRSRRSPPLLLSSLTRSRPLSSLTRARRSPALVAHPLSSLIRTRRSSALVAHPRSSLTRARRSSDLVVHPCSSFIRARRSSALVAHPHSSLILARRSSAPVAHPLPSLTSPLPFDVIPSLATPLFSRHPPVSRHSHSHVTLFIPRNYIHPSPLHASLSLLLLPYMSPSYPLVPRIYLLPSPKYPSRPRTTSCRPPILPPPSLRIYLLPFPRLTPLVPLHVSPSSPPRLSPLSPLFHCVTPCIPPLTALHFPTHRPPSQRSAKLSRSTFPPLRLFFLTHLHLSCCSLLHLCTLPVLHLSSGNSGRVVGRVGTWVSRYYSPIQEGDVNAPWRSPIDLLAIQGQIRRTTTHINSRYVDCGDDFGGGLSEKLSPFIARHGPNGVRRVEVEWVDSDGRPTSHCYVLHDSPLEGYPIAGTHERCVEQCTAMAEALVHNLDERLGSLDKLSGVKLFMPDEWPHGRQERSMVCTEHLESLTMLFRAQESDEIIPGVNKKKAFKELRTAYKKRKPITTVATPKKQPRAKGKEKVDEDDAGGAGSGWGTETPLHRHGSMSEGGGSDEDEDMCVM